MNEELLMEHAAIAIKHEIDRLDSVKKVVIIVGSGNNGADGLALARILQGGYECCVFAPYELKSSLAQLQKKRCDALGVKFVDHLEGGDVVVDALFGSGYVSRGNETVVASMNALLGVKIACDIPTGLGGEGDVFKADITVTMGAAKTILFEDFAKDFVGIIKVAPLGVSPELYEGQTTMFVLEKNDLLLPYRKELSSHKGDFGHLVVVAGEKKGAAWLCAKSGFAFGAGLVSIVGEKDLLDPQIMVRDDFPQNGSAIAIGMGLGEVSQYQMMSFVKKDLPMVIDADVLQSDTIIDILKNGKNMVLTPHPKEFVSLLQKLFSLDIDVATLQKNRFYYAKLFGTRFPDVVLLLKGANTLIVQGERLWVNPCGVPSLAKGGSGDVLAGMIGSLLAQGYSCVDAALQGSLAHALCASQSTINNFSFTPLKFIEELERIK